MGEEVGYSIRFEDLTSAKTRIKFLTDGLLLREALTDPLLSRYSVIMVDEAHERSLSSDILLGVLKKILRKRPELRIIVSSATIQADEIIEFFSQNDKAKLDGANASAESAGQILSLEGRMYPVDVLYLDESAEDYVERAVKTVFDIHASEALGDILLFLTGREEIESAVQKIADGAQSLNPNAPSLMPLPLFAGLTTEQQMYVFETTPEHTRKVIVSTNIAEASLTIDGIVYVIDSGFVKLRAYNAATGIDTLTAVPVSQASANQRAGRAGRTKPGKCYRLYTESTYSTLPASTIPEIQRSNLAPVILQLKALGIDNILRFDFLTPPPAELVTRALELLYSLGTLDDYAKLTRPLGIRMAELAVEPMMAKVLLSASSMSCLSEILSIAAMTSVQGSVWYEDHHSGRKGPELSRRKFAAEEGDHLTLLNVYQAFVTKGRKDAKWCKENHLKFKAMSRAVSIRNQLRRYLERFGIDVEESLTKPRQALSNGNSNIKEAANVQGVMIRKCLTRGYFAQTARMQADGSFKTVNGNVTLFAHPSSLMFNRKADYVIFHEIVETGEKIFIRDITKVEKAWLLDEEIGGYYKTTTATSSI